MIQSIIFHNETHNKQANDYLTSSIDARWSYPRVVFALS